MIIYDSDWANDDDYSRIDDEKINLSVTVDETIIAIADVGRWNGRVRGYKLLGHCLNGIFNCWDSCEYMKLWCDGYNVLGKGSHHDGTNYIKFRKFAPGINTVNRTRVTNAIYTDNPASDKLISRYTRSIRPNVAKVYGWK